MRERRLEREMASQAASAAAAGSQDAAGKENVPTLDAAKTEQQGSHAQGSSPKRQLASAWDSLSPAAALPQQRTPLAAPPQLPPPTAPASVCLCALTAASKSDPCKTVPRGQVFWECYRLISPHRVAIPHCCVLLRVGLRTSEQ